VSKHTELLDKGIKVINSCTSQDQWQVLYRYYYRARERLPSGYYHITALSEAYWKRCKELNIDIRKIK
jgi:hypothetical protein